MRLVAGGVLVEGAHRDAAAEGRGIGGPAGRQVLGALDAGLAAEDLCGGVAAHQFQAVVDGVHALQAFAVVRAVLGAFGDHAGHGSA
ncbi:hypothetical protein [Streptomyces sp. DSM 40907]|uniref:hypothetical protein n=1 Tax=Streptomyces kutzneri TaxID=3051179 RepID=UPI0028D0D5CE|nr:hypothetical protein [Streptomyces sp. DSM 40907]